MTTLTRLAVAIIRHLGFRTVPDGQRLLANDRDDLVRPLIASDRQPPGGEAPGIRMRRPRHPAPRRRICASRSPPEPLTTPSALAKPTALPSISQNASALVPGGVPCAPAGDAARGMMTLGNGGGAKWRWDTGPWP